MTFDAIEVRNMVERKCEDHDSLRKYAAHLGVSPAYLSEVKRGTRPPGPIILKDLKLEKVVAVSYRRTGK